MKRCPVCQTMLFRDMPVCYGCLHRFPEGDDPIGEGALDAQRERGVLDALPSPLDAPALDVTPPDQSKEDALDSGVKVREENALPATSDVDWVLRLELRCPDQPEKSWLISLGSPPAFLAA